LSSTTGDQFGVVVLEEILIEAHVFLLGEDGVVGVDLVLLQKRLISELC
jgi:hypothetical protein